MSMFVPKRLGCCLSGSARRYGDAAIEEGPETAALTPSMAPSQFTPKSLFSLSVGAGLTVWALTRWLGKKE